MARQAQALNLSFACLYVEVTDCSWDSLIQPGETACSSMHLSVSKACPC